MADEGAPKACTWTSPIFSVETAVRTVFRSTALGAVEISSTVPPLKSMPQARPKQGGLKG
jgi:hypothetical protein